MTEVMDEIAVTLDIDWAPDFAIDYAAAELAARGVRATWFVTHLSPAVDRLRQCPDLFELGVHPNFLPRSTHGNTPEAVLSHCLSLVPGAASVRTHALVQSSPLLDVIITGTQLLTDVSLFLPRAPHLTPVEYRRHGRTLLRVPYYWEDDDEMEHAEPGWRLQPLLRGGGLKVFDFHPVHVYLNSASMLAYEGLKAHAPALTRAEQAVAEDFVQAGAGARTLFLELLDHLAVTGGSSCIRDVHRRYWQLKWEGGRPRAL